MLRLLVNRRVLAVGRRRRRPAGGRAVADAVPVDVGAGRARPARRDDRRGGRDARARSLRRVGAGGGTRAADRARAGRPRQARAGRSRACAPRRRRCSTRGRGPKRRPLSRAPGPRSAGRGPKSSARGPRSRRPAARLARARELAPKTASSPLRSSRRARRDVQVGRGVGQCRGVRRPRRHVRAAARAGAPAPDPARGARPRRDRHGAGRRRRAQAHARERERRARRRAAARDRRSEPARDCRRPAVDRRRARQARRPRDHRAVGRRHSRSTRACAGSSRPASRRSRRSASKSSASTSSSISSIPPAAWAALGDGYRVEVRIVIWEAPSVLKVPTSALFRDGEHGRLRGGQRPRAADARRVGHQTGQDAEVTAGLAEGTRVIPSRRHLVDGARVRERPPVN